MPDQGLEHSTVWHSACLTCGKLGSILSTAKNKQQTEQKRTTVAITQTKVPKESLIEKL
jgi:hypothetical protein